MRIVRRKMIAGNWKMNNGASETSKFFDHLESWLSGEGEAVSAAVREEKIEIVIAPPFTSIVCAADRARRTNRIGIAAQNAYYEPSGAFTGEISLGMLAESGCAYVILGHSERRHIFGESDELIAQKLRAAIDSALLPILCVGELLEERESGRMEAVLDRQLGTAWADLGSNDAATGLVIAYEPVWAIGTGRTASIQDADDACALIRDRASKRFGEKAAESLRILYGGSVKPENSAGLLSQDNIDGLLIGGASLAVDSFKLILSSAVC